ncbi:MAG: Txe/YoeB family addiction module toxin [Spirochaetales bacterium]|nr:Txe/YoeB family addiction module toxin [Spirochaetales bacterium]
MNLLFTDDSWDDYQYWLKSDKKILKRVNELIRDIKRHPFEGIGKPEPLKYQLQGCWSRRIDQEHRLVYEVVDSGISIISCRFHY